MARILVEQGAPVVDPPGEDSLARILRDADPPAEGEYGSEEFALFAKALAARGIELQPSSRRIRRSTEGEGK